MTRPCTCDRYVPRRPYRAGRDCHKCWLFAHRPPVRRAWGGRPAEALPLDVPRPDMPVAELADLLAERPPNPPDGWRLWPATRAAYLLLAERFLAAMPAYPDGQFAGRGAVVCGGGGYEPSVYVCVKMLRHVGWRHPIQVWHRGAVEPVSRRVRDLPGVEVVDALPHADRLNRPVAGGWEAKTLAVLACPFEEVLFLDADCYPVGDPDECFEPAHNPHGFVAWPDYPGVQNVYWPTYGLDPDGHSTGVAGGNYVLTKRSTWPALQLANHYDSHSLYYYRHSWADGAVGGFGDQDQMRAALHKTGVKHTRYPAPAEFFEGHTVVYPGPTGRPLFVHRHGSKFADRGRFPQPPRWCPGGLPMEATAWQYFLEWLTVPAAAADFPDEIPGRFGRPACRLWAAACRDRDVLELGRDQGRSTVVAAAAARRVVSLDRASSHDADGWLQRYGLRHKVWLREGEFAALVPTSGGPFTACLIDGGRGRPDVLADAAAVRPHLAPGAVVGFHGYGSPDFPDVAAAADESAARHGWRLLDRAGLLAVFGVPAPT